MFSVYGPNQNLANKMQGMASIFLSYILEGKPIVVKGSKERFRDFIYVDDVVQAWLLAWDNAASFGQTYNLGTGQKTTVETLLKALTAACSAPRHPIEYAGGTPGDQHGLVAGIAKIRAELAWSPAVDLSTGVARMAQFHVGGR
jgi:UDP-glucose 4-epimerase